MINHLVTSGCSFSDNFGTRWPHALGESLGISLYNRGQGSCGNDWIAKSAIHQTQQLLDYGIPASEILVAVMWSGIDRKGLFISKAETADYDKLINPEKWHCNPVNFIDNIPNEPCNGIHVDGYLAGSMSCNFDNTNINKLKQECISKFFPDEALAIESYEHFLRLQWFCSSKGIKLVNQTFMDIMHYPRYPRPNDPTWPLTKDHYRNISPLYNMIDFSNWIFYNDTQGLYEYSRDNDLKFYDDGMHPLPESHQFYVDNFLIPMLKSRGVV